MEQHFIKELSDELINYLVGELDSERKRVLQCLVEDSLEVIDGIYPTISNLYIITETIYLLENEPEFLKDLLNTSNITEYNFKKVILKMANIDEFSENLYGEVNSFIKDNINTNLKNM